MAFGDAGVYAVLFLGLYFEVFLLISFFEKQPEKKTQARPRKYPSVAIIVPCFNEENTIVGTIQSILDLEYPKRKLSVVIVNDGSTDGTLRAARRFRHNPQVSIFSKENGGKYTALNYGIAHSKSDIVGCLDADSFVMKDSLLESIKKFESDARTMAVVPSMHVHRPRRALELMQAVEYTFGIFYKKMFDNLSAISVLPGPFSLYRRKVFEIVGLFRHAHNTEDMEMAFRLHAFGLHIENAHNSIVYTKVPNTLRALIKQRTRWSQGFLQNSRDYKYMFFNRRFGYFGSLILPFGIAMFFGTLYTTGFIVFNLAHSLAVKVNNSWAAHIPPHLPHLAFSWFYLNTSMMTILVVMTILLTVVSIVIGQRIAGRNFGMGALVLFLALFGFISPVWLFKAAWGAARDTESAWR